MSGKIELRSTRDGLPPVEDSHGTRLEGWQKIGEKEMTRRGYTIYLWKKEFFHSTSRPKKCEEGSSLEDLTTWFGEIETRESRETQEPGNCFVYDEDTFSVRDLMNALDDVEKREMADLSDIGELPPGKKGGKKRRNRKRNTKRKTKSRKTHRSRRSRRCRI